MEKESGIRFTCNLHTSGWVDVAGKVLLYFRVSSVLMEKRRSYSCFMVPKWRWICVWHWVCNLRDINFQLRITYLIRIQRDWGNEFLVNVGGKLLNSFDCPFVRLENKIRSPNYNTLIKTTSIIPHRVLLSMFNPQMNIHRKNRITKADNKLIWIPTCSPSTTHNQETMFLILFTLVTHTHVHWFAWWPIPIVVVHQQQWWHCIGRQTTMKERTY